MSDSGFPLPSRDAQEYPPGPPWLAPPLNSQCEPGSNTSLALAVLSEKIRTGVLQPIELMERIVAQAAAATGAKGVALALRRRSGEVVCCAAYGDMSPPPGTILSEGSGFTGECLRNRALMICEDAERDARVDRAACRRLGVASIVAAPIEDQGSAVGVLEALSDQQAAFSKKHIEALLTLACLAKSAITPLNPDTGHFTTQDVPPPPVVPEPAHQVSSKLGSLRVPDFLEKLEDVASWPERVPRRIRWAMACGVAAAVLLAVFATALLFWMWRHNSDAVMGKAEQPKPQPIVSAKPSAGTFLPSLASVVRHREHSARQPLVVKASSVEKLANGEAGALASSDRRSSISLNDNARAPDPFTPLKASDATELKTLLSSPERLPAPALPTSEGVTPARLKHEVEPVYPTEARRMRIEGPVVLRAAIDADGRVSSIGLIKGSPVLAQAAMAAVRQWRYLPSELNHHPTPSTTDITIVFHLE